jgi:hypothetical protein
MHMGTDRYDYKVSWLNGMLGFIKSLYGKWIKNANIFIYQVAVTLYLLLLSDYKAVGLRTALVLKHFSMFFKLLVIFVFLPFLQIHVQ